MQRNMQFQLPFDALNEATLPKPTDPFAVGSKLTVLVVCTTILGPLVFLIVLYTDTTEFRLLLVWSIPGVGIIVLIAEEDDI